MSVQLNGPDFDKGMKTIRWQQYQTQAGLLNCPDFDEGIPDFLGLAGVFTTAKTFSLPQ